MTKRKEIVVWLPAIFSEFAAIVCCIVFCAIGGERKIMYFQMPGAALIPALIPLYGKLTKKPISVWISVILAVHIFFACDLGSGLWFYDRYLWWDLWMHGLFGFVCCVLFFTFLMRWNGAKLNPAGCLLIVFVFTMGVAALWEVWEYTYDTLTGSDSQQVHDCIEMGLSPVADTMEDIIIAIAGCALFYLTLFLDKLQNYKIFSKVTGFNGFVKE